MDSIAVKTGQVVNMQNRQQQFVDTIHCRCPTRRLSNPQSNAVYKIFRQNIAKLVAGNGQIVYKPIVRSHSQNIVNELTP